MGGVVLRIVRRFASCTFVRKEPSMPPSALLPVLAPQHRGVPRRTTAAASAAVRTVTSGGRPHPTRFTRAFQELRCRCPAEVRAYADCVQRHARDEDEDDESGGDRGTGSGGGTASGAASAMLRQGVCQAEFDEVKACWRRIRRGDV